MLSLFKNAFLSSIKKSEEAVPTNNVQQEGNGTQIAENPEAQNTKSTDDPISYNLFIDELLKCPEYTMKQYLEELEKDTAIPPPTPGKKNSHDDIRQWRVIIGSVKIKNVLPGSNLDAFFLEWNIGSQRVVHVKKRKKLALYYLGKLKCNVRTHLLYQNEGSSQYTEVDFRSCMKYSTSYSSLLQEKLSVRVWKYEKYKLNTLEGLASKPLKDICRGTVYQQMDLYKSIEGKPTLWKSLYYNLYFQEIFPFKLYFKEWKVYGYQTFRELNYAILRRKKSQNRATTVNPEQQNHSNFPTSPSCYAGSNSTQNPNQANHANLPDPLEFDDMPHCIPKLSLKIISSVPYMTGLSLTTYPIKNTLLPYWDDVGHIVFHGTMYELYSSILHVEVFDLYANSKKIVAKGDCFLKGIIDQCRIEVQLRPPIWWIREMNFKNNESFLSSLEFGFVEGKICIENVPQYTQKGEMGYIDQGHVNLFIEIKEISKIVTAENQKHTYPYVEVSFDGDTRYTRVLHDSSTKVFDDLLIFPICLPPKEEISASHIQQKNDIFINVWSKGDTFDCDCGGTAFSLYELFFDEKRRRREMVDISVIDSKTGERLHSKSSKVEKKNQLTFTFSTEASSVITFSSWTIPDLLTYAGITSFDAPDFCAFPELIQARLPEFESNFKEECLKHQSTDDFSSRSFYCYALDQRLTSQFLCSFCAKIIPPNSIDNCNAVAHFIHCIHFLPNRGLFYRSFRELHMESTVSYNIATSISYSAYSNKEDPIQKTGLTRIWATPNFTLNARSGSIIDHALLHVSFLLGLSEVPFVCLGSLWDGNPHCWVCTIHFRAAGPNSYGYIKFWETSNNTCYTLRRRILSRQVLKQIFDTIQDNKEQKTAQVTSTFAKKKVFHYINRLHPKKTDIEVPPFEDMEFVLDNERQAANGKPHAKCPKLPYQTLDIIFNHHNIWVNKQDKNPGNVWFDVWNQNLWHQFLPQKQNIKPCFFRKGTQAPIDKAINVEETVTMIKSHCQASFTNQRDSRNIVTRWNDDPDLERFLVQGLEILHRKDIAHPDAIKSIREERRIWKQLLYSKVPATFRLKAFVLHINTANSKTIADVLVGRSSLLDFSSHSATFTLAVYMKSLPKGLSSVYVMLVVVQRIPFWERKILKKFKHNNRKRRSQRTSPASSRRFSQATSTLSIKGLQTLDQYNEKEQSECENKIQSRKDFPQQQHQIHQDIKEQFSSALIRKDSTVLNVVDDEIFDSRKEIYDGLQSPREKKLKKKKLKVTFPPGSVYGIIKLRKQRFDFPWNEVSMFRTILSCTNKCLTEGLGLPPDRIKTYCCDYAKGYIAFCIPPGVSSGSGKSEKPEKVLQRLTESFPSILLDFSKLREITGDDATIERENKGKEPRASEYNKKVQSQGKTIIMAGQRQRKGMKKQSSTINNNLSDKNEDFSCIDKANQENIDGMSLTNHAELLKFCEDMEAAHPELFGELKTYYENIGYSSEHASYFAAYYSAVDLSQRINTETL